MEGLVVCVLGVGGREGNMWRIESDSSFVGVYMC